MTRETQGEVRDRMAYAFWMHAPVWLRNTRLGLWLLPYAGRIGYPQKEQPDE